MKTITLCGSTKFKDAFKKREVELSLAGCAVYSCAMWGHQDDPLTTEQKLTLDAVHMAKIANSDEVHVLNVGGYVGESTRREIYYSIAMGKKLTFLESHHANARQWAHGRI